MNLSDQVCSLEHANRLIELGLNSPSIFCWARQDGFTNWGIELNPCREDLKRIGRTYYPAYTVAELGEMLPVTDGSFSQNFNKCKDNGKNKWITNYGTQYSFDEKEADSRAKMLIHLLKNNILKVEDLNNATK